MYYDQKSCTMSYTGLMFGAIQLGGPAGEDYRKAAEFGGARGLPMGGMVCGGTVNGVVDGIIYGDGQSWVDGFCVHSGIA